jgi:cell division protein FtsZ
MSDEISKLSRPLVIKVIGAGGAGAGAVELMAKSDMAELQFALLDTDARALQQCAIAQRMLLGLERTHGLGTGGDPEFARVLAQEQTEQLKQLCANTDLIFIVAGMGGGTGSGVSPILAAAAKEAGALVLCLVTMPFDFEGHRRLKQAHQGLQQLRAASDAVICLPNSKVCKTIDGQTSFPDVFRLTDALLAQGVRAIWQMLARPGLIKVDFKYLYSVVRGRHAESSFATAEGRGEHRAREVVEKLVCSPLLEEGKSLSEADAVLVSLVGGPDMTISDVNKVMEQINRRIESGHVIMGAAIDDDFAGRIALTVIASRNGKAGGSSSQEAAPESNRISNLGSAGELDTSFFESAPQPRPTSRFIAPAPAATAQKTEELLKQTSGRARKTASKWKQEMLALEIVSRGRFEKSEPTIHRGADLDVPTYIRRGIPLN